MRIEYSHRDHSDTVGAAEMMKLVFCVRKRADIPAGEDEARFIDMENSTIFFAEEHEVVTG